MLILKTVTMIARETLCKHIKIAHKKIRAGFLASPDDRQICFTLVRKRFLGQTSVWIRRFTIHL